LVGFEIEFQLTIQSKTKKLKDSWSKQGQRLIQSKTWKTWS